MKIIVVHNSYQQAGGEDVSFRQNCTLLRRLGHTVYPFQENNARIPGMDLIQIGLRTVWSLESHRRLKDQVEDIRPDLVHFHNTFPLLSPSCYYAARSRGAAVVQTLHNFRFICPNALLLRNNAPCEDCLTSPSCFPSVLHACYRNSRLATAAVAGMLNLHRLIGTYSKTVDAYIALARFSRDKFISGGLPASKVHVLPNFLADDPGFGTGSGGYALFVGRLSEEKGLRLLLDAWNLIPNIPLKIVGDGPLFQLTAAANVEWLGVRSADSVVQLMSDAKCVVVPSLWYEAAPRVVMESLAVGTPVVAPAHGFFPEAISDPANGVLFQPGSMTELAKAIERMFCSNGAYGSQRQAARATYLLKYTHEVFSSSLLDIYESAIEQRGNTCAKGHARKFAARQ